MSNIKVRFENTGIEMRKVIKYQERVEKIDKEIRNNKVSHDSYNAKMYKIELSQSNIEEKIFQIENSKKLEIIHQSHQNF